MTATVVPAIKQGGSGQERLQTLEEQRQERLMAEAFAMIPFLTSIAAQFVPWEAEVMATEAVEDAVIRRFPWYVDTHCLRPFLITAARWRCWAELRKRRLDVISIEDAPLYALAVMPFDSPQSRLEEVERCFERLDPVRLEMLLLKDLYGHTIAEIARKFPQTTKGSKNPEGNIAVLICRTRQKICRWLGGKHHV